ncbi:MAG: DUF4465 domain-containing protein [Bacteroidales bacterium]|jgi:hypothetical protein|nr:DUF4465 domain-containing protein [Bacteroidales bacterium]
MKKTILLSLFILFFTGLLFAQQSDTVMLNLQNPTYPTKFNFIGNGYWEHTYNDVGYTWFTSQIYKFSHLIEGPGSSYGGYAWNGFTVCNSGDNTNHTSQGWWGNYEWGCMAGGGIKTDAQGNVLKDENGDVVVQQGLPYLVGYWNYLIEPEWWDPIYGGLFLDEPTHCFQIILDDVQEYEAVGVYVNNHPFTYYSNLYGCPPSRPLNQVGDHFKLIFHGLNPDLSESGKSVEYFMAIFENGQLTQNNKWDWVDLSSLGEIGGFYCTMVSTDVNSMGPLSPMYFCMDKLQVRTKEIFTFVPVIDIIDVPESASVGEPLILTGKVIPENATNQTIVWSVESAGETGATITDNTFNATGIGTAVVTATIANGVAIDEDFSLNFNISVERASQTPPDAPTLESKTTTSITLNPITGCEYRMDGGAWQASNTFEDLTPNTTYGFEARKAETETHYASGSSPTAYFKTDFIGVKENGLPLFSILPNPATGELRVTSYELQVTSIEVFDIYGRAVSTHYSLFTTHYSIDISHLQAGIYFVRIVSEKGTRVAKFVKQ